MLRSARPWGSKRVEIGRDTYVTAAGRQFAKDQGIALCVAQWQSMSQAPVEQGGQHPYVDAQTGAAYARKPEEMTHLHTNVLVKKTHPRIALRGQLDLLEAELICAQTAATEDGRERLCSALGEVLEFVRQILAAEVKEQPLGEIQLLGYDGEGLRWASHHVEKSVGIGHVIPDYRMGKHCAALNLLRAKVRQAELCAALAFAEQGARQDLIVALNRLSSAIYLLFCQEVKSHG